MVKINFNVNLKDPFGKDVANPKTGEVESFKEFLCTKLFNGGEGLTDDEKAKAFLIMMRIADSKEAVAIEDFESVLIKKICGRQMTVGTFGQLVNLLNGGKEA